jgi:C-terminal processing protease CtpA/Prc
MARSRSRGETSFLRASFGPEIVWHEISSPGASFAMKRERHFDGPVAVLIGPRTFSAAEDFAMSFDAMKRGILVGSKTAGSTGQPLTFALPGGGSARICVKRDTYPDGREFVGQGIAPQVEVAATMEDIRSGRDPVLDRAVAELTKARQSP